MNSNLATAYAAERHQKPGLGMKEAARKTGFTSDRALYKFLRENAGFQGTTPPRPLIKSGLFYIRHGQYYRGQVPHQTAITMATNEGLAYIADLKNKQELQG